MTAEDPVVLASSLHDPAKSTADLLMMPAKD